MTGECARVLKQCTMTGVRIDDELRIRQMLAESERVVPVKCCRNNNGWPRPEPN
jgi:hypothetical protein